MIPNLSNRPEGELNQDLLRALTTAEIEHVVDIYMAARCRMVLYCGLYQHLFHRHGAFSSAGGFGGNKSVQS